MRVKSLFLATVVSLLFGQAWAGESDQNVALAWLAQREAATLEEQVRINEIPAPPFGEAARAEYFRQRFMELGLTEVRVDAVGNVLGVRPGSGAGPRVVVAAHLDTVFPAEVSVKVSRQGKILKGPGIADNARGLTVLLAVIEALQVHKVATQGPITFVANVGEEGRGDLRGTRHLFDVTLKDQIDHFISLDGAGLRVANAAVGSLRYRVTFRSAGGHSYGAFGLVNPIHALGRAIAKIAVWEVPEKPKTTFNVGIVEGGTSINSIAHTAALEMDMRSESIEELAKLDAAFHRDVAAAVEEENLFWSTRARNPFTRTTNGARPVVATVEKVGDRPAGRLAETDPLFLAVVAANRALGIKGEFAAGSTDSNVPLGRGLSGLNLSCGGSGAGNHALDESFDSTDSHLGTQRVYLVVLGISSQTR